MFADGHENGRADTFPHIAVETPADIAARVADMEAQKTATCKTKCLKTIEYIPFVNFLYYTFFDDALGPPPTRDDVNQLVNTIALIAALLYTIGAALPMSVSYDELEFWDWQYSCTGPYGCVGRHPLLLVDGVPHQGRSDALMKTAAMSVVALSTSTLLCVVVLMSLSTLPAAMEPDHKFQYWWWVHKWIIAAAAVLMVYGVFQTTLGMNYMFELKVPDYARLELCKEAGWIELTDKPIDDNGNKQFGFPGVNVSLLLTEGATLPDGHVYPVPEALCGSGVWAFVECTTGTVVFLTLFVAMVASGYGSLAYELEMLPCHGKLHAGSDYNAQVAESQRELLSRSSPRAADVAINPRQQFGGFDESI